MNVELGIFVERDGLPAVRLERPFGVPVEQVWRALTEPGSLAAWFPSPTVDLQPHVGGRVEFPPAPCWNSIHRGAWGTPGATTSCSSSAGRAARAACSLSPTCWRSAAPRW
ncbi:SRPBCC domain-containing protein, partial [Streptomyces sp. PU-14G]|uniref:SRPBCC domain-containing protein n=1 Tax=Streptomyces sp. PU-14G TaxID=2800808 RepID=UPI0034E0519E